MKLPIAALVLLLVLSVLLSACGEKPTLEITPTPTGSTPVISPSSAPVTTPTALPTPGPTVDPNAVVTGGTVTVGIPKEPKYLSPLLNSGPVGELASHFMVEGLLDISPDGHHVPVLVEDLPTVSEDGLVITYKLKTGVRFSNGDPFTCADVQFTWKAIMSSLSQVDKSGYGWISSIECPDDHTAAMTLSKVYSGYLELFPFIVPKGAGDLNSLPSWPYHTAPIGTGPWKVSEWQIGDHITLSKNPTYREEGKPYLDNIILKILPSRDAGFQMLSAGETDITWDLSEGDIPALKDLAARGIGYVTTPSGESEMLLLNLADPKIDAPADPAANPHPILSDIKVRQAIQSGIDKAYITDNLLDGIVGVSLSALPSGIFTCPQEASGYDPEKAKALLEEAGWKAGAGGIREKDGVHLSLKVITDAENPLRVRIETYLVEALKAIGVELVAQNLPSKVFFTNWEAGGLRKHGAFDMLLLSGGGINDLTTALWRSYHSSRIPSAANQGRGDNYARYSNTDVDAWLNEAANTADPERQHDLLCKVTAQINKDIPVIYLYERLLVSGYQTRLQNLQLSPGPGNFTVGSENWWVRP